MGKSEASVLTDPTMKLAYAPASNPTMVPGRRNFFKYRELGVTEATNGRMRAQITSADEGGLTEPTGWHYHVCDMQLVYMLDGWVELEFETGESIKLTAGDSLMIPGGMKHNEIRTSSKLNLLEVSIPADMGTVPCEKPGA